MNVFFIFPLELALFSAIHKLF